MKKDELKKVKLANELGIEFEEAANFFSEETLSDMNMQHVLGGGVYIFKCMSNNDNCSCNVSKDKSKDNCPISTDISVSV